MSTIPDRRASLASRVWTREVVRPARRERGPRNLIRFVVFAGISAGWLLTAHSEPFPTLPNICGVGFAAGALQSLLIFAVQINDDVHIRRDRRLASASDSAPSQGGC